MAAPPAPAPPAPPQCPVCHDLLFEAMVASCGHSLCSQCVQATERNRGGARRKCPECRVTIEPYQPNFVLRDVIETTFPDAHRARLQQTARHRIDELVKKHDIMTAGRGLPDETILSIINALVECKTIVDARERLRGQDKSSGIFVLASDAPVAISHPFERYALADSATKTVFYALTREP